MEEEVQYAVIVHDGQLGVSVLALTVGLGAVEILFDGELEGVALIAIQIPAAWASTLNERVELLCGENRAVDNRNGV